MAQLKDLLVTGPARFLSKTVFSSEVDINNKVNLKDDVNIAGDVDIDGGAIIDGEIYSSGNITANGDITSIGNNTFTGKNVFKDVSNTYNTEDTKKFIIGNDSSAFVFGGDGLQCFSGLNSTTGKIFHMNYYGGPVQIGNTGQTDSFTVFKNTTINGSLNINGLSGDTPAYLKSASTGSYLGYKDSSGTTLGFLGYSGANAPIAYYNSGSHQIFNSGASATFEVGSTQANTPALKWGAINSRNPYIGYCTSSTDGTFMIGSLVGTSYTTGLAIGGKSGNLLWKGNAVPVATRATLTASRALASDSTGKITQSAVTSTELGYLSGVTSAIQTQINGKQATITGAATTITSSDLTASRALVSNSSGKVAVSAVTSTELGYLDGVTSSIQTQLNTLGDNIDKIDIFDTGTSIPSGADLNTYTTLGKYYAGSGNTAASLLNCPTTENFTLFVLRRTTGSSLTQVLIAITGRTYVRSADSQGSFRAWQKYATDIDIEDLQDQIDNYYKQGIKTNVAFTNHPDNTAGYYLIGTDDAVAWRNRRTIFFVESRHSGNGLVSINYGVNNGTVSDASAYCDISYFGSKLTGRGTEFEDNAFLCYYNNTNQKFYFFWQYKDYNSTRLITFENAFGGFTPSQDTSAFYTTQDSIAATYGVLKSKLRKPWVKGDLITNAVWNDYAEYRESAEKIKPGRVVIENGDGSISVSEKRLISGASIVSDTYGFIIGETEKCKTPVATAGRVLRYPFEDKTIYKAGDAVCTGPNGTISKMTREEIKEYPDCILGYVSEIPSYEEWSEKHIKVNGRIWIKI